MTENANLTIDELAREAGMTVRNVRAHQSRGLLPAGRDPGAHRLLRRRSTSSAFRLIQELQAEGFNLKAIERLIDEANGSSEGMFEFRRALLTSFTDEEPELTTAEELEARLRRSLRRQDPAQGREARPDPPARRRPLRGAEPHPAQRGRGARVAGHPALARARGGRADQSPLERDRRRPSSACSWTTWWARTAERTPEEWARLADALERLRPLATDAVAAGFQQTMSQAVERQLEKMLQK